MRYRKQNGSAPGIAFTVNDNSKYKLPANTSSEIDAITLVVPILADKGEPNKIYSRLSAQQLVDIFGEINFDRHGINSDIALRWAMNGGLVSVCRLEHQPHIANAILELKMEEKEKDVLVHVPSKSIIAYADVANDSSPFNKGIADGFIRNTGNIKASIKTEAVSIKLPVLELSTSVSSVNAIDSDNKAQNELNAKINTAGKVTSAPLYAFMARGGGNWGNKIKVGFGRGTDTMNNVSVKDFEVFYNNTSKIIYKNTALVEGITDEFGINLGLQFKVNNDTKSGVENIVGNTDVRILTNDICRNTIEDSIFNYINSVIAFCDTKTEDPDKEAYAIVKERFQVIADSIMDAEIEASSLVRHDGTTSNILLSQNIFGMISSNLETSGLAFKPLVDGEFPLTGGKDDLNVGLRRFDWKHNAQSSEDATIEKKVIDFYQGKIDDKLLSWTHIKGNVIMALDAPIPVINVCDSLTRFGEGKRYDWCFFTGNMSMNDANYLDIVQHKNSCNLNGEDFSTYYTGQSCNIVHPTRNKVYKVPLVYTFTELLTNWYSGSRRNPIASPTMPVPMIQRESVRPDIYANEELDELAYNDIAYVFKRNNGSYVLHSNTMCGNKGIGSRLKEAHNAINFKDLIVTVHETLLDHLITLTEGASIGAVERDVNLRVARFGAYFENAPFVKVGYADEEDRKRGLTTVEITSNMFGTNKYFKLIFNAETETLSLAE